MTNHELQKLLTPSEDKGRGGGGSKLLGVKLSKEQTQAYNTSLAAKRLAQDEVAHVFRQVGHGPLHDADSFFVVGSPDTNGKHVSSKVWLKNVQQKMTRSVDRDKWLWMIGALDSKLSGVTHRKVDDLVRDSLGKSGPLATTPRDLDNCVFCNTTTTTINTADAPHSKSKSASASFSSQMIHVSKHDPFRIVSIPLWTEENKDKRDMCFDVVELYSFIQRNNNNNNIPNPMYKTLGPAFFTDAQVEHVEQWYQGYVSLQEELDKRTLSPKDHEQLIMLGQHLYAQDIENIQKSNVNNNNNNNNNNNGSSSSSSLMDRVISFIPESIRSVVHTKVVENSISMLRYIWNNPWWARVAIIVSDIIRMTICMIMTLYMLKENTTRTLSALYAVVFDAFVCKILSLAQYYFGSMFKGLSDTLRLSIASLMDTVKRIFDKFGLSFFSWALEQMIQFLSIILQSANEVGFIGTALATAIAVMVYPPLGVILTTRLLYKTGQVALRASQHLIEKWSPKRSLEFGDSSMDRFQGTGVGDWSKPQHQLKVFMHVLGMLCPMTGVVGQKICEAGMGLLAKLFDPFFMLTSCASAFIDIVEFAYYIYTGNQEGIDSKVQSCVTSVLAYQFAYEGCICFGKSKCSK